MLFANSDSGPYFFPDDSSSYKTHTESTAQIRSHGDSTISLIFMKLNHCYNMDLEVCVLSMRKALSLSPYTRKKKIPLNEKDGYGVVLNL